MFLNKSKSFSILNFLISRIFVALIYSYRALLKPFMSGGPSCRFYPSCSEYSKQAFLLYSPLEAALFTIKRLLKCNPFGSFGYDPVPVKNLEIKYEQK